MNSPTASVIWWLRSLDGLNPHQDVPRSRPERFQTVEQVGGRFADKVETASLAIQCWARTWEQAETDARMILAEASTATLPDNVLSIRPQNAYRFASEDGLPRWQITIDITTKLI